MDMTELFFMAESEGQLPTKQGKINATINTLKKIPRYRLGYEELETALEENGLTMKEISPKEIRYISSQVRNLKI